MPRHSGADSARLIFPLFLALSAWTGLGLGACNPAQVVKTSPARAPATRRPDAATGPAAPGSDAGFTLTTPDVAPACAASCQPGQSCQQGACVDDCRPEAAVACAAPTTCDFLTGRCVPPDAGCVLTGTPMVCGTGEFPPRCGPGSRCDATRGCVADKGCARVVCDAANFCRGADCPANRRWRRRGSASDAGSDRRRRGGQHRRRGGQRRRDGRRAFAACR